MIRYTNYVSGNLVGVRYDFEQQGDALPEHAHDENSLHNVIVLAGSVRVTGPSLPEATLVAGDVFDFDGKLPHRIEALRNGSTILNLMLYPPPPTEQLRTESGTIPDRI
jgi:quercetin dioxygenase-like cupin family protein